MADFFAELKRRKVFRVAALYAVVAWVLIQVSDVVLPTFGAPAWVNRTIIFFLAVGFLPALIAAWAYELTPDGIKADANAHEASSRAAPLHPINYLILGIVLLVAGFQVADRFIGPGRAARSTTAQTIASGGGAAYPIRTQINLPDAFSGIVCDVSPDGRRVVLSGVSGQQRGLWLRSLDDLDLSFIPGTGPIDEEGGSAGGARFSPDGQSLVFERRGRLEIMSLSSHASRVLVAEGAVSNPLWGPDGTIYYAVSDGGIWRVAAEGGVPEEVIPPDPDLPEVFVLVDVLPAGRGILYLPRLGTIAVASLENGDRKHLVEGIFARVTATHDLLFTSDEGDLQLAPLDPASLELSAPPIVMQEDRIGPQPFVLSQRGTLIYPPASTGFASIGRIELVWVERFGAATPVEPGWSFTPLGDPAWRLSPDGRQIAYESWADLWIKTLPRGPAQRVTFSGGFRSEQLARGPAWSPDGRTVAFTLITDAAEPANYDLWQVQASGAREPQPWIDDAERGFLQPEWSRDGNWLIMRTAALAPTTGRRDIVAVRGDEDVIVPLVANKEFTEQAPALSPDGRWLAYTSDASGREEVYVRPFPAVGSGRWQVSADGGMAPVWASGSDELFFVNAERELVSVRLDTADSFAVIETKALFELGPEFVVRARSDFIDLAPDDQRFLLGRYLETSKSLVVVQNFSDALRSVGLD